jgi:Xaa-Pro aminopeptidase
MMTTKRYLPLILLLLLSLGIEAQTPEQRYFDWTALPFSKEELASRRTKLIEALKAENKSGLVIIPSRDGFSYGETFRQLDDFYYFTGLEVPNGLLVIDVAQARSLVYTPMMDLRFESASRPNDFPGRPLLGDQEIVRQSGLSMLDINDFPNLIDSLPERNRTILLNFGRRGEVSLAPTGYVATYSPVQVMMKALQSNHAGLNFDNIYGAVAKVRMIKSPVEIAIMRKSTAINVTGIKTAAKAVKPGVDERYLEGILEGNYKVNGSQRLAFGSIIKSGPNSLWPWRILATHYDRRNRVMDQGDLVIFDVGCEYQHYVSDVGRTFPVSGRFSDRQREILALEVSISDQIIDFIRPGITFQDIKHLTDSIIPDDAKKYMQVGLYFGHHLGLSTGDPNLTDAPLEAGMIFTVEPWYYNHDEQIAVFTEDVLLITEDGCENLSEDLPRTPERLERLMKE